MVPQFFPPRCSWFCWAHSRIDGYHVSVCLKHFTKHVAHWDLDLQWLFTYFHMAFRPHKPSCLLTGKSALQNCLSSIWPLGTSQGWIKYSPWPFKFTARLPRWRAFDSQRWSARRWRMLLRASRDLWGQKMSHVYRVSSSRQFVSRKEIERAFNVLEPVAHERKFSTRFNPNSISDIISLCSLQVFDFNSKGRNLSCQFAMPPNCRHV